jgi:hypothetical protein
VGVAGAVAEVISMRKKSIGRCKRDQRAKLSRYLKPKFEVRALHKQTEQRKRRKQRGGCLGIDAREMGGERQGRSRSRCTGAGKVSIKFC